MTPVIIFDLGKVLVDFDYSIAVKKIAAHSDQPPENLHGFLGNSRWLVEYESGRLTRRGLFEAVRAATGFRGDLAMFSKFFADIFAEIPSMISLHAELRQRGFQTFIFSNTNDLAIEHIRRDFSFFKHFDGHILSYEVGALKPQPEIYEAMEKLCGRSGADLIYIDDLPANIAAGKARGWQTVLHERPEQTRHVLVSLGVL